MKRKFVGLALSLFAFGTLGAQKPTYKRSAPPALLKRARVKESAAADSARRAVPNANIVAMELEQEGGKLIYSFDMKTPGKDGIDEVAVDAMTGRQVGKVQHESAADERKEAAADKAAARKKAGGGH
jgi:uncharacterized iron-regulated membrane protein